MQAKTAKSERRLEMAGWATNRRLASAAGHYMVAVTVVAVESGQAARGHCPAEMRGHTPLRPLAVTDPV